MGEGETTRSEEEHHMINGFCKECGAQQHQHQAVMCGEPNTTYVDNGETHTKIVYMGDELCSCGQYMGEGKTIRTEEEHYILDDMCILCGAEKHEHVASMCGEASDEFEIIVGNDDSHKKYHYSGDELCSCGKYISDGNTTQSVEKHDFGTTDVCSKCGYTRLKMMPYALPFLSIHTNVILREMPYEASNATRTIYNDKEALYIIARTQNKYGNIWGKTLEGDFVYIGDSPDFGDVALNLDDILKENSGILLTNLGVRFSENKKEYSDLNDAEQAAFISTLDMFAENVQTGGRWDYKVYLNSDRKYIVYVDGTYDILSGEEIGNIHYGYLGSSITINEEGLLWGGGVVNIIENKRIADFFKAYWDSEEDINSIRQGINYFESGNWTPIRSNEILN